MLFIAISSIFVITVRFYSLPTVKIVILRLPN